jgi:hypothetical protein
MADSSFPEHAGESERKGDSNKKSEQNKEKRIAVAEFVGGIIGVGIGCGFTEVELHYWALLFYWISVSFGIDGLVKFMGHSKRLWWVLMVSNLLIFGLIAAFQLGKSPLPSGILFWLCFGLLIGVAVSGWILFFWTFRKLEAGKHSVASDTPFRVSDDFEFQPIEGYYIDRKTKLRICAKCLLPPTRMVVHLSHGTVADEYEIWRPTWTCGHCGNAYLRNETDDPLPF